MDKLTTFFKKAYGVRSIFGNPDFLNWYFNPRQDERLFMPECIVAVDATGQIVSHYGGLEYTLQLRDEQIPLIWGVNAFTLDTWRGQGINSRIVEFLGANEINGVIGFTRKTATFYDSIGYNLFGYARFVRYVLIIDETKTREAVNAIGQDFSRCLTDGMGCHATLPAPPDVVELEKTRMKEYRFAFSVRVAATTHRNGAFLTWRFADNPFVDYKLYGIITAGAVTAYAAVRKETLAPLKHQVNRIIDIFGDADQVGLLLAHVKQQSIAQGCIYIDFSMMGSLYDDALRSTGFARLENEDAAVLPQVTSPITDRPNCEYVGLKSRTHQSKLDALSPETVYFTRLDSDRDRCV